MDTPWKQARSQQRSKRQEERLSKLPGGSKQVNSGRHWFSPRDVKLSGFLVEARLTDKNSYTVSRKEWKTLTGQALAANCLPGMQVDFESGLGRESLFIMRLIDHQDTLTRLTEAEGEIERLKELLAARDALLSELQE